jgi:hypothetical protein
MDYDAASIRLPAIARALAPDPSIPLKEDLPHQMLLHQMLPDAREPASGQFEIATSVHFVCLPTRLKGPESVETGTAAAVSGDKALASSIRDHCLGDT